MNSRALKFSANLGLLWADLPLADAIGAAAAAGFDAVECHWPYDTPPENVQAALRKAGLPMLGLNTRRGDAAAGDFGLAALPGRDSEARAAIDEAIAYAAKVGAVHVHVMAGCAAGRAAERVFRENLAHACETAAAQGIDIVIEPLNRHDAPGYFLKTTAQAVGLIRAVGAANLKLMFDCYHVQLSEGDVGGRLRALLPLIGHVQFASVPRRSAPGQGPPDYDAVFGLLRDLGWTKPLGAEYLPHGPTEASLGWMARYRRG